MARHSSRHLIYVVTTQVSLQGHAPSAICICSLHSWGRPQARLPAATESKQIVFLGFSGN